MRLKSFVKQTAIGKLIWPFLRMLKGWGIYCSHWAESVEMGRRAKNGKKHIFYCGICESSNMGDMAQTYCTLNWMHKYYPEYEILICRTSSIFNPRFQMLRKMQQSMKKEDLIFFQSGYNTHDLGDGREDLMHQRIIEAFPDNEMIMLPQTVFFRFEERKKQCASVYNAHKKLLFLARDPVSERYAREMFPNLTVMLYPDIVTSLIGSTDIPQGNREKIYLCRRKDVEQFYSEDDYIKFEKLLSQIDQTVVADTIIAASNRDIYNSLDKYVSNIVNYFGTFRLVVTDKYHGLIFALVSNTPVITLKTKDHKVTSGYEWFSKIYPDRVFFAENEGKMMELATEILSNPSYSKLDNYFDREYYQKLKEKIDGWENSNGNM